MLQALAKYFSEFKILKQAPREFWILNLVINFFEMLAYFSFITVLTLYLTDNVGLNDEHAGNIMGYFTLFLSLIMFFSGFIIDSIGVKKALLISMVILIPCRLLLGLTTPVDDWNLKGNLDFEKTHAAIIEQEYDKYYFTQSSKSLADAQINIIEKYQVFEASGDETIEVLNDDSQKRFDLFMLALEKSPAIKTAFPGDLKEEMKDQDKLKKAVVMMVGEEPAFVKKYYLNLDVEQEELESLILSVVHAFPELRPTKQLPGWMISMTDNVIYKNTLGAIGLFKNSPQYTFMDMLVIAMHLILLVTALGEALMVPAIYVALRRYTTKRTSGTAFNFQYLTMNIGAVLSFAMFDLLRLNFGNESILLFGSLMAVICSIGVLTLRSGIKVEEDGSIIEMPPVKKENRENPIAIAISVMKESAFWRFMLFISLLIGVKLTFTHQFIVFPKYYTRILGENAPIGMMNTINPTIITIGLILFIPVIMRFSVFRLIIVGTIVSSLSVFALVIPAEVFKLIGWSLHNGYLTLILIQIVVFSFGELIWSPRLSEYTVTIAPKGREGSYMSMAVLPMFIAKPLNGWLSGKLLTSYCPEGVMNDISSGARGWHNGPEMMWLILGLIAISSPILILMLKNVIKPDESSPLDEEAEESAEEGSKEEATVTT